MNMVGEIKPELQSTITFVKIDQMMVACYEEYIVKELTPEKTEILTAGRFFAVMAIGCRRLGLHDEAEIWNMRLNTLYWMMCKMGFKFGRTYVGRQSPGITYFLNIMFGGIHLE